MNLKTVYITMVIASAAIADTVRRGPLGKNSIREYYSRAISARFSKLVDKRVPSGFMGVRGKKLVTNMQSLKGPYPDATYKRNSPAFLQMRGKKEDELIDYGEKRIPLSFMGMRGKKENKGQYFGAINYFSDKRTPMGFMGMRGKKSLLKNQDKETQPSIFRLSSNY